MARIRALPIPAPVIDYSNYDWKREIERENQHLEELRKLAIEKNEGELVGQEIAFPRGDGSARYMIWSEKPLTLLHLPYGDAWTAEYILIRGLRLSDVKTMVHRNDRLREMFVG